MKQRISPSIFPDPIDRDYIPMDDDSCLSESDFYPPSDNRVWKSNVEDIEGGDNFADYCRCFFRILDEEDYYEK